MIQISHPRLTVAAVQAAPAFLDLEAAVDKTVEFIRRAARGGARLVAFPETWIPGYPWYIWLDSPAANMQFVQRYFDNSLRLDSQEYARIREAAAEHEIWVSLGYSERSGGSLYMGQALINDRGESVSVRRKLKPTHVERAVFGEGDGSDLAVIETPIGNIGALCCWEHLQPLTKYAMYSQNEQIHIAAWPSFSLYRGAAFALGPELNNAASQLYAAEGQCFVVAPCATVSEAMVELMCDNDAKRQLLRVGGGFARIFAPDGSPLGKTLAEDEEGLVLAEIDLGTISLAKAAADPVGHYSRPDVTRLLLNKSACQRVVTHGLPEAPVAGEHHSPDIALPAGG